MKIIRLIDDFAILPGSDEFMPLRHFCPGGGYDLEDTPRGRPLHGTDIRRGDCDVCHKEIPPKVIFMFKLWCFQNNR